MVFDEVTAKAALKALFPSGMVMYPTVQCPYHLHYGTLGMCVIHTNTNLKHLNVTNMQKNKRNQEEGNIFSQHYKSGNKAGYALKVWGLWLTLLCIYALFNSK